MKICISSTFIDLIEYRSIALEVCDILKAKQLAMELMFSSNESPLETSLNLVKESDIYVCIIGKRYGTVPSGYAESITHLEYKEAIKLNKPVYIFIISNVKRDTELQNFIKEISEKHVYSEVSDKHDFRRELLNTLRCNHFKELRIDSKFIVDLEAEHMRLNDHGYAMKFISDKETLDLLHVFSKNMSGLKSIIDGIYASNGELPGDLEGFIQKLGCDCEKIKDIPYYENPFINRDWEAFNLGIPNWMNALKLSFLNLKVRLLEYEIQRKYTNELELALLLAKQELFDFIGVSHMD